MLRGGALLFSLLGCSYKIFFVSMYCYAESVIIKKVCPLFLTHSAQKQNKQQVEVSEVTFLGSVAKVRMETFSKASAVLLFGSVHESGSN